MDDYSFDLVVALITNLELLRSFVERSTGELFPLYYQIEVPKNYKISEGHTLEDLTPHTTRVPKLDNLKETLLILLVDIERALDALNPLDRLKIILSLGEQYQKKDEITLSESCIKIIYQLVEFLNYG